MRLLFPDNAPRIPIEAYHCADVVGLQFLREIERIIRERLNQEFMPNETVDDIVDDIYEDIEDASVIFHDIADVGFLYGLSAETMTYEYARGILKKYYDFWKNYDYYE